MNQQEPMDDAALDEIISRAIAETPEDGHDRRLRLARLEKTWHDGAQRDLRRRRLVHISSWAAVAAGVLIGLSYIAGMWRVGGVEKSPALTQQNPTQLTPNEGRNGERE